MRLALAVVLVACGADEAARRARWRMQQRRGRERMEQLMRTKPYLFTKKPTPRPSLKPTPAPSTAKPTKYPTPAPTPKPDPTRKPTPKPTHVPTLVPSTSVPSFAPTNVPVPAPTSRHERAMRLADQEPAQQCRATMWNALTESRTRNACWAGNWHYYNRFGTRRATQSISEYRNARFTASKYDALSLPVDVRRLAQDAPVFEKHAACNPGLARLPKRLMNALQKKGGIWSKATYVLTVRHSYAQCSILGWEDTQRRDSGDNLGRHSSVLILDDQLCTIQTARWAKSGDAEQWGEDVRLMTHRGRLVATVVLTPKFEDRDVIPQKFGVYELVLGVSGNELVAAFERAPPLFFSEKHLVVESRLRNVGLVVRHKKLEFLAYLGKSKLILRESLREATAHSACKPPWTKCGEVTGKKTKQLAAGRYHWLHNNVNPLLLRRHGLLLAVGHDRPFKSRWITHDELPVNGYKNITKTTSWNTYLHYFILYNATTLDHVATSSPFCFPSARLDMRRCDLVQFVTSLTRGDGDDVLISFGINDCDSGIVALPADLIVAFSLGCSDRKVRSTTLRHAHEAAAQIRQKEERWNATLGMKWSALMRPDPPAKPGAVSSIYDCKGTHENCPENLVSPLFKGPCDRRGNYCASSREPLPDHASF